MPCSCRIPAEKYPESADWGPLFWKLLHSLAEYAGTLNMNVSKTMEVLQTDEIRAWTLVLTLLQGVLPCDVCQTHYSEWLTEHNPSVLTTLPYAQIGAWIRNYVWSLHNEINEGNEKPRFSYDVLSLTYKSVNITNTWKQLDPIILRAIKLNGLTLFPWKKWLGHVRMLQGIYGI